MEAKLAVVVLECRVKLVRPMDPAAIDDHHDLFVRFAEGRHHLMEILTQLLGIKVGHDLREDFGGAILGFFRSTCNFSLLRRCPAKFTYLDSPGSLLSL